VQVFFLWGRTDGDKLPPPVIRELESLQGRYSSLFVDLQKSARVQSTAVAVDAQWAMLCTHPLLQQGAKPSPALVVTATGKSTRVAIDLIDWVRSQYPDFRVGQRVDPFPIDGEPDSDAGLRIARPEAPDRTAGSSSPYTIAAQRLWANAWGAWFA